MAEPNIRLGATTQTAAVDEGLRAYMLRVYNYMAIGTAVTGITAWVVANTALINLFYAARADGAVGPTILGWIAFISPLVFILAMNFGINRMKASTLQLLYWAVTVVFGISLANIFLTFTGESIARVFFIAASLFGVMSLYGYTTKRDLTNWGSFLFMGLIGIIIAMVVNIFIGSTMIQFAISVIGVLVFTGLAAYDTQRIKNTYDAVSHSGELMAKSAVQGALSLYLDFLNLFIMLLHLFGNRE